MSALPWPVDKTDLLRQLWAEGKSCYAIGIQLGISRNAVMGKVRRLDLERRREQPKPYTPRQKPAKRAHRATGNHQGIRIVPKPTLPSLTRLKPLRLPLIEPISGGVTILEATGCKYATGQDDKHRHIFCNADTAPNSSWCPFHFEIVHRKADLVPVRRAA